MIFPRTKRGRRRREQRKAERYARDYAGPHAPYDHGVFIRHQWCLLWDVREPPCWGRIEAAHVVKRSRRPGKDNWRSLVPLCSAHHRHFEDDLANAPENFETKYGIDLEAAAARLVEEGCGGISEP